MKKHFMFPLSILLLITKLQPCIYCVFHFQFFVKKTTILLIDLTNLK